MEQVSKEHVPVGGKLEVEVAGRKVKLTNPGARAVLKAQEECLQPNGQVSLVKYVSLVLQRWCEPPLDIDTFGDEDELIEFLRLWRDFRRPSSVEQMKAEPPYCSVGGTSKITVGPGREVTVVNPGLKWVLYAQEESTLPSGVLSVLHFVEMILQNCAVGKPKFDEVFVHEDEVVEFLRLFRLLRRNPRSSSSGEGKEPGSTAVDGGGERGA